MKIKFCSKFTLQFCHETLYKCVNNLRALMDRGFPNSMLMYANRANTFRN